ncbi:MAG: hypothetical protein AAF598_19505, partial [Bacteroidota bacterium]
TSEASPNILVSGDFSPDKLKSRAASGHVYVLRLNSRGQFLWIAGVPKSQVIMKGYPEEASCIVHHINGQTYLLFNENPRTQESLKNGSIVDYYGSETARHTCLREVYINNKGKVQYRFIENTLDKQEAIWPNETCFVSDQKAVLSARQGNKLRFLKIILIDQWMKRT